MKDFGARKLRLFRSQPQVCYDTYFNFTKNRNVPNYDIPPLGKTIRVTNLSGEPIILNRRKVRGGEFR